jgi:hypothetical protein
VAAEKDSAKLRDELAKLQAQASEAPEEVKPMIAIMVKKLEARIAELGR